MTKLQNFEYGIDIMMPESVLIERGNLESFITQVAISILHEPDEDTPAVAGRAFLHWLRLGACLDAGVPFEQAFAWFSEDVSACCEQLFDEETGDIRSAIMPLYEAALNHDIMLLSLLEILPEHRGRGLGLAVTDRIVEIFKSSCALFVADLTPLTAADVAQGHEEWYDMMELERFGDDVTDGRRKLSSYFSTIDFRPLPGTGLMALTPAFQRDPLTPKLP